ncbi:recombination protein O N-terminal domain-containing protein [Erythrobacter sp. F6033]|uniref:DNA repair protein RecO n=1 Tax=Erythrobacter sp. F6033 TaxID=2926401 RepID=UPI001FF64A68|nr:recombination protein O N-terminal domain-containing protein [Erythrobacter sp. F6033]MCK0127974.1 recombination protein O N-terminal domain-containing protein [Erythrobacter sp. F6033]
MNISAPALLIASWAHGETAAIARLLTEEYGLVAGYVAGGRGRQMRPVMIPGNKVALELRSKSDSQLPFARVELEESRGPWMTEPLPAAAITWACALSASTLPERNPYPSLYQALDGLLSAICAAPSARGWLGAMVTYEAMLLRELGYGGAKPEIDADLDAQIEIFRKLHKPIGQYLLVDAKTDVMAARVALGERLVRMTK